MKYSAILEQRLSEGSEPQDIISGEIFPNTPCYLKFQKPGIWTLKFENGDTYDVIVEDAYKFGGSKLKKTFIFDENPWVFIIMNDRTYFSNRETGEEYEEAISPDEIIEVSDDYVLLKNNGQDEITLYSLREQKPVVWLSNLVYHNEKSIVWNEEDEMTNTNRIIVFSLYDLHKKHTIETSDYNIDYKNERILFVIGNTVDEITLAEEFEKKSVCKFKGSFAAFISPIIIASNSYINGVNHLYITDISEDKVLKDIVVGGEIAEINDKCLIKVNDQLQAINNLNLDDIGISNANITATFVKFKFFPCEWDVFYIKTAETVFKNIHQYKYRQKRSHLLSINSSDDVELNSSYGDVVIASDYFLYYFINEAYVFEKGGVGFRQTVGGKIFAIDNQIVLIKDNTISRLNDNGYWRKCYVESDYDTSYLRKYGILKSIRVGKCKSILSYCDYGKFECAVYGKFSGLRFDKYVLIEEGLRRLTIDNYEIIRFCEAVSPNMNWGVKKTDDGFAIIHIVDSNVVTEGILTELYDSSKYMNVLFSEDGNQIMFRDSEQTSVLDIVSGETKTFPVWSYVKQINGIRPLFRIAGALQPKLINPVTGQVIDHKEMSKSQFVSPDRKLYADGNLSEYIEYRFADSQTVITKEKYQKYLKSLSFALVEKDSHEWRRIRRDRMNLVLDHFVYLNMKFPKFFNNDRSGKTWAKWILEGNNSFGTKDFLNLLIERYGKAIIRKVNDNSVYAEIDLGRPLTFMNYVSFSYDSRYMALAGYRENGGGLFLLYDLKEHKNVINSNQWNAVWTTAFSQGGAVAAYTSRPLTFFARGKEEYVWDDDDSENKITGRSFLTFSPDGKFLALSNQGYIHKYDKNGNVQPGWGHCPSSMVEIRSTDNFFTKIICYNDLSDSGIAEASLRASVASVSFSMDNSKLMMVGNDGVVIIRNLHLDTYADE